MTKLPPLYILYGSATGNSEHIAKDLAANLKDSNKPDFVSEVICWELNQFKKCQKVWEEEIPSESSFKKYPVVIVVSTTGNGDPPENAGRFVRYIKRKTTVDLQPFRNVSYAVLGLGDTNYDQFCQSAKTVDTKLSLLGGTRAKALGKADEATGLEETVEPWINSVIDDIRNEVQRSGRSIDANDNDERETGSQADETKDEIVEEKKEDFIEQKFESACSVKSKSIGVDIIRKLAQKLNISVPFEDVPVSCLPSLGSSLSSCQLMSKDATEAFLKTDICVLDENKTTTSSTSSCQYNMAAPYESTIMSAKYVTNTNTGPAKEAALILLENNQDVAKASACFDSGFPLKNNDDLNGKRVIHMEFSLPDDFSLQYSPGDSIGIIVNNEIAATNKVLDMLQRCHGILPDQDLLINDLNHKTARQVVSGDIDICTVVKRRTLSALACHTSDESEAKLLRLLSSKTEVGDKLYEAFVGSQLLSVSDILDLFPSCTPPIEALVGIVPCIAPRYYSVSSSPLVHESSVTVAFSVVDYLTPSIDTKLTEDFPQFSKRRKHGVATSYLETISAPLLASVEGAIAASKVRIFPKPTQEFVLPINTRIPLILIGPGTGVAPFIGFLGHRQAQARKDKAYKAEATAGTWRGGYDLVEGEIPVTSRIDSDLAFGAEYRKTQKIGTIDLFFGCRHKEHDWLFRNEMNEYLKSGTLTSLHTAFSRDGAGEKIYVQHKLLEESNRKRIVKLLTEENASVFICGDGNAMAKDVVNAFEELLTKYSDISNPKDFIAKMKSNRKFLLDIWS